MHHHIRPRLGIIAYSLLGATVGIGFAVLWLYVLAPGQSLWLVGAAATACGVLLLAVAALAHGARHRRTRNHRRAHARKAV